MDDTAMTEDEFDAARAAARARGLTGPGERRTYIACDCFTHAMLIEVDDLSVDVTILGTLTPQGMDLRGRLREAWRAFWSGKPYSEYVCWHGVEELTQVRDIIDAALATRRDNE